MITNVLLSDYIAEIPWAQSLSNAFIESNEYYLEKFEKLIVNKRKKDDSLDNSNPSVNFDEETWDFRDYYASNSESLLIRFMSVPPEIIMEMKFYAIYELVRGVKVTTINRKVSIFSKLFRNITKDMTSRNLALLTTDNIVKTISFSDKVHGMKSSEYIIAKSVLEFIVNNYNIPLAVDFNVLKQKSEEETRLASNMQDENKLDNIPEELFNIIFNKSWEVMNDETQPRDYRAMACMIIILSQTGLRVGDLVMLRTDSLRKMVLPKSGYEAHYIHYTMQKNTRGFEPLKEYDIYATGPAVTAFNMLLEIRKTSRFYNEPYLFVIEPYRKSFDKFPISGNNFGKQYRNFLYEYLYDVIKQDWEHVAKCIFKPHTKQAELLSYPDTRQFRVCVCTDLYNKGVSPLFIRKYMGHLESQMEGYYIRPKDKFQENTAFAGKVIREIVEGVEPQGQYGKEIKEALIKFINENKLDVYKDIEGVIQALGNKIRIRAKDGGACIVCNMFSCAQDNRTNEVMCAYNLCPNIYHFFYSIDMTYQTFKITQETFNTNLNNGFIRAAEKELNKMKDIINRRLLKEILELEKEISKHGVNYIIDKYPSLLDIIENIEDIKLEIEEWKQKKL